MRETCKFKIFQLAIGNNGVAKFKKKTFASFFAFLLKCSKFTKFIKLPSNYPPKLFLKLQTIPQKQSFAWVATITFCWNSNNLQLKTKDFASSIVTLLPLSLSLLNTPWHLTLKRSKKIIPDTNLALVKIFRFFMANFKTCETYWISLQLAPLLSMKFQLIPQKYFLQKANQYLCSVKIAAFYNY